MHHCSQIPAAAWQQLAGATWSKLTKVDVEGHLGSWGPFWSARGCSRDGCRGAWGMCERCETSRW